MPTTWQTKEAKFSQYIKWQAIDVLINAVYTYLHVYSDTTHLTWICVTYIATTLSTSFPIPVQLLSAFRSSFATEIQKVI